MRTHSRSVSGMLLALALAGCGDSGATPAAPAAKTETAYTRLGAHAGISKLVQDLLAEVLADPKINGYFLNSSLDQAHLAGCLTDQIASLTGGPGKYGCKSMKDAHAKLGISSADFGDFMVHLAHALAMDKVADADITTILRAFDPLSRDIVEDATSDQTIYQRVGRKPAIQTVVTGFHARVMADARINAFFAKTSADRLATCLVRQVCGATGGPCKYGDEIADAEPGVKSACRDMATSHMGLGISVADFTVLAGDLVAELDADGVTPADRDAMVKVLTPLCKDIVEKDPASCP
jgi:hemoglobin